MRRYQKKKMFKAAIAWILASAMMIASMSGAGLFGVINNTDIVSAAVAVDIDHSPVFPFFQGESAESTSMGASASEPYRISNLQQLYNLAYVVNNGNETAESGRKYRDSYFILTNNITINTGTFSDDGVYSSSAGEDPIEWTPIGCIGSEFSGSIDGDGHTIKGMYIADDSADADETGKGFVGVLSKENSDDEDGTVTEVKNLDLKNVYIKGSIHTSGAVVGYAQGNADDYAYIKNCRTYGCINVQSCDDSSHTTQGRHTGGIVGAGAYVDVDNCYSAVGVSYKTQTDTVASQSVGGIIGLLAAGTVNVVSDCINAGTITAKLDGEQLTSAISTGGIVGSAQQAAVETELENTSDPDATQTPEATLSPDSGETTDVDKCYVTDCINKGTVSTESTSTTNNSYGTFSGGIMGYSFDRTSSATVSNCINYSDVSVTADFNVYEGGIVGYGSANNSYTTGNVIYSKSSSQSTEIDYSCKIGILSGYAVNTLGLCYWMSGNENGFNAYGDTNITTDSGCMAYAAVSEAKMMGTDTNSDMIYSDYVTNSTEVADVENNDYAWILVSEESLEILATYCQAVDVGAGDILNHLTSQSDFIPVLGDFISNSSDNKEWVRDDLNDGYPYQVTMDYYQTLSPAFDLGDGSGSNPYIIKTKSDLECMETYMDSYTVALYPNDLLDTSGNQLLEKNIGNGDIDSVYYHFKDQYFYQTQNLTYNTGNFTYSSGEIYYDGTKLSELVGSDSIETANSIFTGEFDGIYNGGGKTISGLCISLDDTYSGTGIGFFGSVANGMLTHINIDNSAIYIDSDAAITDVGFLSGESNNETISNCTITSKCYMQISESYYNANPLVTAVTVESNIINDTSDDGTNFSSSEYVSGFVGGITGIAEKSNINGCTNNATIYLEGVQSAGGIVGYASETNINSSSNTGNVTANRYVGGIVGTSAYANRYAESNYDEKITDCSNSGDITANPWATVISNQINENSDITTSIEANEFNKTYRAGDYAGGITGRNFIGISKCSNDGNVSAKAISGGIAGMSYGSVTQSMNYGEVSATEYIQTCTENAVTYSLGTNGENVGGIIGLVGLYDKDGALLSDYYPAGSDVTVSYCGNVGNVISTYATDGETDSNHTDSVGAFIGYKHSTYILGKDLTSCLNLGMIKQNDSYVFDKYMSSGTVDVINNPINMSGVYTCNDDSDSDTSFTSNQLISGEAAYMLNTISGADCYWWRQEIGQDDYPVTVKYKSDDNKRIFKVNLYSESDTANVASIQYVNSGSWIDESKVGVSDTSLFEFINKASNEIMSTSNPVYCDTDIIYRLKSDSGDDITDDSDDQNNDNNDSNMNNNQTQAPMQSPSAAPVATQIPNSTASPEVTTEPTLSPTVTPTVEPTQAPENVKVTKSNVTYKVDTDSNSATVSTAKIKSDGTLTIPDTITVDGEKIKVTEIAPKAFSGNKKVKTVKLGNNIKTVGNKAFYNCKKLKKFTLGTKQKTSNKKALKQAVLQKNSILQSSLGDTLNQADIGMPSIKNASVVKVNIGASALQNCTSLSQVIINSQVRKIGNAAFRNCVKLSSIIIRSLILKTVGGKALKGVNHCKISVPKVKIKPYSILFKNKGQGKKVVVAKV